MNESESYQPEENDIREEALRQARAEMEEQVRQEIVNIFNEQLEGLWERLYPVIGETATAAVFHSAKREVTRDHPFMSGVEVDETGIHLARLRQDLTVLDQATIRAGILALMDNVIAILTALTGDILVRKVQPLVEQFRQNLEED